ncbi:TPA: hypothetical protein I8235_000978 [Kluyvera intermedia]|nr:hypothetical protein [Kluyvera intermedia]
MTTSANETFHESIWKEKRVAPLEYCSLARASRLLDCEEEDILHWGATGAIRLHINMSGNQVFIPFEEEFATKKTTDTLAHEFKPLDEDDFYRGVILNGSSGLGYGYIYETETEKYLSEDGCKYVPSTAHGLWSPLYSYNSIFRALLSGKSPTLSSIDFMDGAEDDEKRIGQHNASLITMTMFKRWFAVRNEVFQTESWGEIIDDGCKSELEKLIDISDIFITRKYIDLIHNHAVTGTPMPIREGAIDDTRVIGRPGNAAKIHANAERFAIDRERLLKFAIFVLSKYPDECRGERKEVSPEKWKDAILNHARESIGVIIPNEQVMLKQLRAAVNNGNGKK